MSLMPFSPLVSRDNVFSLYCISRALCSFLSLAFSALSCTYLTGALPPHLHQEQGKRLLPVFLLGANHSAWHRMLFSVAGGVAGPRTPSWDLHLTSFCPNITEAGGRTIPHWPCLPPTAKFLFSQVSALFPASVLYLHSHTHAQIPSE